MVKILPAGANVNLNLGKDPMERLMDTLRVASQVQNVVNQAQLQRDKREAIKEESFQTTMLNSLSGVDKSNIASVSAAENSLKSIRDRFVEENPGLIDKADAFYGTILSTQINPVKQTHLEFNKFQNEIMSKMESLDSKIIDLPDEVILDGTTDLFKDDFQSLAKTISRYNLKAGEFNSVMPDANLELGENVLNAKSVLRKLPSMLVGKFDAVEQKLYSDLLNNQISESIFDAQLSNHYNKTTGRLTKESMPLLGSEISNLYAKEYIPINNITSQIEDNSLVKYADIPDLQKDKVLTYVQEFDDSAIPPVYYIDGVNYGTKEKTLEVLNSKLYQLKLAIEKKDGEYKSYSAQAYGEPRSYVNKLDSSGKWPWETKEKNFQFQLEDKNQNKIPDYLEREEDVSVNKNKMPDYLKFKSIPLNKGPRDELVKLFGEDNVPKNINSQDLEKLQKLYSDMSNTIIDEFKNKNKSVPFIMLQTLNRVPQILSNLNSKLNKN